jgi:hypothetical protein
VDLPPPPQGRLRRRGWQVAGFLADRSAASPRRGRCPGGPSGEARDPPFRGLADRERRHRHERAGRARRASACHHPVLEREQHLRLRIDRLRTARARGDDHHDLALHARGDVEVGRRARDPSQWHRRALRRAGAAGRRSRDARGARGTAEPGQGGPVRRRQAVALGDRRRGSSPRSRHAAALRASASAASPWSA